MTHTLMKANEAVKDEKYHLYDKKGRLMSVHTYTFNGVCFCLSDPYSRGYVPDTYFIAPVPRKPKLFSPYVDEDKFFDVDNLPDYIAPEPFMQQGDSLMEDEEAQDAVRGLIAYCKSIAEAWGV
jgi:hypothetical protein